ncbi:uncharacterized protein METZ01_LOCUS390389, partial [marine metagenome]
MRHVTTLSPSRGNALTPIVDFNPLWYNVQLNPEDQSSAQARASQG